MIRTLIQLGAPLFTLLGIGLSAYGTYDLTRYYYPLRVLDFGRMALRVTVLFVLGRSVDARRDVRLLGDFAINPEDKEQSLAGLFLIFWGFVAQAAGAACWIADTVWGLVVVKLRS